MNVLELLKSKGIDAKKAAATKGGEWWSACPGCGGRDRFHVWPDQNGGTGSYWCRGCGKSGDRIQFLMDFEGKSYPEACAALDIALEKDTYQAPKFKPRTKKPAAAPRDPVPVPDPLSDLWMERAEKLTAWAQVYLAKNKKQLEWLKNRGIKKETIEKFRLGWNPGKNGKDLFRPREKWGLPVELKENGRKKVLWIPRGLVIPWIKDGRVRRIRIRRPEGLPRFVVLEGSDTTVMVIGDRMRAYIVLEAELDALLCWQAAGDLAGAVGLGSTRPPDPAAAEVLRQAAVILLAHDYDAAGQKALEWWRINFPRGEHWPVPAGGDPGEAYQAGVDIRAWISAGLPSAWRVGQSLLGSKKKRAPQKTPGESAGTPAGILELAELLKRHPVTIHNTLERTRIRQGQRWARENWDVSKRISELVYMTPAVFEYLAGHPEAVITGGNVFYEGSRIQGRKKNDPESKRYF